MKFDWTNFTENDFTDYCTLVHRGYIIVCTDSKEVYESLVKRFGHDVAASAESWTELASVGEWYEEYEFEIEIMEA